MKLRAAVLFILLLVIQAYAVESLAELEEKIVSEMKVIIALRAEIRSAKDEAAQREMKVTEIKQSGNLFNRLLLGKQLEDLHRLLAENDRRERQIRARKAAVDAWREEAMLLIRKSKLENEAEVTQHLDLVSFYSIEEAGKRLRVLRKAHARSENEKEKNELEKEFERVKIEREKLVAEFKKFYKTEESE